MWRRASGRRKVGKVDEEVVRGREFDIVAMLEVVERLLEDGEERTRRWSAEGDEERG